MTDRERLIELILNCERVDLPLPIEYQEHLADYLLANGVKVPLAKVGDYVRVKGLAQFWRVDAIHYYREGLPQITITYGKISNTLAFSDPELFEIFTKEEAEEKLKELNDNGNRFT